MWLKYEKVYAILNYVNILRTYVRITKNKNERVTNYGQESFHHRRFG